MGAKLGQVAALEPAKPRGYEASALNALKHGVLSRHVVLPHEDRAEFEALLTALQTEHQPRGPTELHLVEELAGILWRKRRVLMAEAAKLNDTLGSQFSSASNLGDAVPTDARLAGARYAKRELFTLTPEARADYIEDVREDLAHTERAEKALAAGGANAYQQALAALREDSRAWWQRELEDGDYREGAEGLATFIEWKLRPELEGQLAAVERQQEVAAFLQGGAACDMISYSENLQRYETHLDRKLERTLAMLLKLREVKLLE
jgi:hypothetical protein